MDTDSLREKIAREIADHIAVDREPIDVTLETADAILAIPEIKRLKAIETLVDQLMAGKVSDPEFGAKLAEIDMAA